MTENNQPAKQPWSLLINWNDRNVAEEGNYSWSGMALDAGDAEIQARSEMFDAHAEEQGWTDDEILEAAERRGDILNFGGSVIENICGANIWAAPDALKAFNAIRARINGEWDNPDLMAIGPLGSITDDILRIIEPVIVRLEGRS